jgi:hypothetical protein
MKEWDERLVRRQEALIAAVMELKRWFRPNRTRDEAIAYLSDQEYGEWQRVKYRGLHWRCEVEKLGKLASLAMLDGGLVVVDDELIDCIEDHLVAKE